MEILTLGNELLRQRTERINSINSEVTHIAAKMLELLIQQKGIGLAGPQVGYMHRIFVAKLEKSPGLVFINPSVIETSEETEKCEEGCLSLPGVWADVVRPSSVRVQAWNEKGRPFTLETNGLLARCILHELDHLDGVLFIDHLSEVKRNRLLAKFEKGQRV